MRIVGQGLRYKRIAAIFGSRSDKGGIERATGGDGLAGGKQGHALLTALETLFTSLPLSPAFA